MRNRVPAFGVAAVLAVRIVLSGAIVGSVGGAAVARDVEFQPFAAQATRVAEAMEFLGSPLSAEDRASCTPAARRTPPRASPRSAGPRQALPRPCDINPESRVKVARGAAAAELVEAGGGRSS